MARQAFNMLLSATLVASALVSVGINQPAMAKTKRQATGRGAYFVPPPPPYAPSILPENVAHARVINQSDTIPEVAEKPPENPYKKYIFTRDASDMPRVVKFGKIQNRNVITYNVHNKT